MIFWLEGGVCAPKGFKANGIHCGIRKNKSKKDLALIVSDIPASAAAVYTTNLVKGAPILVTQANLADGKAQAMVCNSGNANTCNANGVEIAQGMCRLVEEAAGIPAGDVIVASTGVIGQPLSLAPIADGMPALAQGLGKHSDCAAHAIMTTDTALKEVAISFTLGGVKCTLGGIAKGSGMIHPNMATMLVFLTTDAAVSPSILHQALQGCVDDTFNMISVDGDTSTNDMVSIMANGLAGNTPVEAADSEDYQSLCQALGRVCTALCRDIAKDGEGASKLIRCIVKDAPDTATAKKAAKAVVCSNLLKAAIFGADANWGRVLCALGYSGAVLDVNKIDVFFSSLAGKVEVCRSGAGLPFSEEAAKAVLSEEEITVGVNLNAGSCTAVSWGCDLTYDYVHINGDYRS